MTNEQIETMLDTIISDFFGKKTFNDLDGYLKEQSLLHYEGNILETLPKFFWDLQNYFKMKIRVEEIEDDEKIDAAMQMLSKEDQKRVNLSSFVVDRLIKIQENERKQLKTTINKLIK